MPAKSSVKKVALALGLLIGVLFILTQLNIISLAGVGSGTVLSLSNVQFTSSSGNWANENVWKAQVAVGTGATKVQGKVSSSPTLLSSGTDKSTKTLKVDYQLTKEQFTYPLTLAQTQPQYAKVEGVNFKLTPFSDYGYSILSGGTNFISPQCTIELFGLSRDVEGNKGIEIPNSCVQEYKEICKHDGGTAVKSTTAVNLFNIVSYPTTGYKCLKVSTDTSQPSATFYRPIEKQQLIEANIILNNGQFDEILKLSTKDQIKISNDKLVRASMVGGLSSFQVDAPEYSSFYVGRTSGGITTPITTGVYAQLPTNNLPTINTFSDEKDVLEKIQNHNYQLDKIFKFKETGFQSYAIGVDFSYGRLNTVYTSQEEITTAKFSTSGIGLSTGGQATSALILDRTGKPTTFPIIDLEMKASFVGLVRPEAIPEISVTPSKLSLLAGGSGGTVTVNVQNKGDTSGAVYVNPPKCSPSGIVTNPSATVNKVGASWSQTYRITGNAGTYSCTVESYNEDKTKTDSETFTVSIGTECNLKPINNQVLDKDNCVLTCPLQAKAGFTIDYSDCTYDAIINTSQTTAGICQPDTTRFFSGAVWNNQTCSWACKDNINPSYDKDGKPFCPTSCTATSQCLNGFACVGGKCLPKEDNTLLYVGIGAGVLILAFAYYITRNNKRGRRK